ncbi:MAG: hypothetical protein PHG25_01760 [Candidatus Pacebacteria bacterium]|nr:hypothetical protein [Candidatus Paceibacterota bacterium]
MKLTRQSVLAASSLIIGGFLGASALVAAAANWTNAPANPPSNNVLAPINVGFNGNTTIQEKLDSLQIDGGLGVVGNLIAPNLIVSTSTSNSVVSAGYFLTAADSTGKVKWSAPSAAAQECGSDGRMGTVSDGNINDWGSSGGGDTIEYYCRSHVIRICLGKEACTWRTTGITSDDSHTCGDNTHLKTGTAGYSAWAYAPASLCAGSSPCVQSNFNLGVGGKGQVMAYNKSTSEFYTCSASRQKGIIDETGQIVKGVAVQ